MFRASGVIVLLFWYWRDAGNRKRLRSDGNGKQSISAIRG